LAHLWGSADEVSLPGSGCIGSTPVPAIVGSKIPAHVKQAERTVSLLAKDVVCGALLAATIVIEDAPLMPLTAADN
jgi:hypothetical protein